MSKIRLLPLRRIIRGVALLGAALVTSILSCTVSMAAGSVADSSHATLANEKGVIGNELPRWRFSLPTQMLPTFAFDDDEGALSLSSYSLSFAELSQKERQSQAEGKENAKQSALKAVGLSLLMPGAGQLYTKRNGQARTFFGIEAGVWLGYAGFSLYSDWRKEDYIHYAQVHAGIDPNDKDDAFFSNISVFDDRAQYVTLGRALEPDDPFYPDSPEWQWSWDSDASRQEFRDLFNQQRSANRNAEFMFVAAAVNRLVSAALALRAVKKNNAQMSDGDSSDWGFSKATNSATTQSRNHISLAPLGVYQSSADGLLLRFTRSF